MSESPEGIHRHHTNDQARRSATPSPPAPISRSRCGSHRSNEEMPDADRAAVYIAPTARPALDAPRAMATGHCRTPAPRRNSWALEQLGANRIAEW